MHVTSDSGTVFDIQPYSVHDGPGIRTLVFLKGCVLRCAWCSNPESLLPRPQLRHVPQLCTQCRRCLDACEFRKLACENTVGAAPPFDSCARCTHLSCTSVCRAGALVRCGRELTVAQVYDTVIRDRPFWGNDGGVTLSGGEPFCQPGFAIALLRRLKNAGVSTAVESSLCVPFEAIEPALPWIDFFMFDVKFVDAGHHARYCGRRNELILDNIRRLVDVFSGPALPRMPLVPGVNDSPEALAELAAFLADTGLLYIQLVPYMRLGIDKYEQLGLRYGMDKIEAASETVMRMARSRLTALGIRCV